MQTYPPEYEQRMGSVVYIPIRPLRGPTSPYIKNEDRTTGGDRNLGAVSIRKTVLPGMAIPMLKIRRPNGRLIFNMEIAIGR